jgi:hypothetical protein
LFFIFCASFCLPQCSLAALRSLNDQDPEVCEEMVGNQQQDAANLVMNDISDNQS